MSGEGFVREGAPPSQSSPIKGEEGEKMESFAVGITRRAGGILLEQFRKPLVIEYKSKDNTNPVTDADRRSEEYLREAILKEYPDHGVLAEEGSQVDSQSSDFIWVLDPLDGTVNYLNGLPVFGVSVGVLYRGEPVLGCIFTPSPTRSDGSVYHARRGNGAFRDGEAIGVYESASPQRGKITVFPWSFAALYNQKKGLKGRIGELRSPGSVAYELAMTASGVIQYAIFTSPWVWDVAGGITLVSEAGGVALYRQKGDKSWDAFRGFTTAEGAVPDGEGLKEWRASWVFGGREMARYVTEHLSPRSRVARRVSRWQRRLLG